MPDSKREQIIQAIETRLQAITTANLYNFNIGTNVFRVRQSFNDSELPVVTIWDIEETSEYKYHKNTTTLDLKVSMHTLFGTVNPSVQANKMLADLIQAMTDADTSLGGLADGIEYTGSDIAYPEDGALSVSVEASFNVKYTTVKGDPYT